MKKIFIAIAVLLSVQSFGQSNNDIFKIRTLNLNNNFSARDGAELLYFNDTLFLLGGWHPDSIPVTYSQQWYSIDGGFNFYQKAVGAFTRRHTFALGELNDKMWIWQGDNSYTSVQNDVWSYTSSTGIWTQVTADKGVNGNGRALAPWAIHKTYMYSISGSTKTDCVRSTDGITWTVVATLPALMQNIINGTAYSFNGNLYMGGGHYDVGGSPLTMNDKMWESTDDGVTWAIVAQGDKFKTDYPSMVATSTHLWWLGGASSTGVNTKSIMFSNNGKDWVTMPYNITARHASGMCVVPGVGGAPDEVFIVQGNLQNDSRKIIKINY